MDEYIDIPTAAQETCEICGFDDFEHDDWCPMNDIYSEDADLDMYDFMEDINECE